MHGSARDRLAHRQAIPSDSVAPQPRLGQPAKATALHRPPSGQYAFLLQAGVSGATLTIAEAESRRCGVPSASKIDDLLSPMETALREAFARGYRAGAADTRARIIEAAAGCDAVLLTSSNIADNQTERAQRGTVRPLVMQVFEAESGLTTAEMGRRVKALNPNVSETSVANELTRNRGKHYKRFRGKWFPLSNEEGQRETAAVATNDTPPITNGAGH